MNNIPRPEYPRPQFARDTWQNLNGEWSYTFDFGRSGMDRQLFLSHGFAGRIQVPFCPESALSGVQHTDFIDAMWYHRPLLIPADWTARVLLQFGAVDYQCDVFIDGQLAGRHAGGQCSFTCEITRFVKPGATHDLVLWVRDNTRGYIQPSGKQSEKHQSHDCHYTRVTGIWQTVWLEAVPVAGVRNVQIIPDFDGSQFHLVPDFWALADGHRWRVTVCSGGAVVAQEQRPQVNGVPLTLKIASPQPWAPGTPHLYDLELEVLDARGGVVDRVKSYAGLRKIHIVGNQIFLNNQPLYLRLVLDQGYYPDGIWTAPTDAAVRRDIELSMAAGFNGARLHQKVFEPRFHYWADRLGYLTWGESSCWGCNTSSIEGRDNFQREWREIIIRDRNHPSIIAWTPWNEAWWSQNEEQFGRTLIESYDLAKALDATRPVHTASGGTHCRTDIWSVHCYASDGPGLAAVIAARQDGNLDRAQKVIGESAPYDGQPYVVAEFGGQKWIPADRRAHGDSSWGYGDAPKTLEEFYQRLETQVKTIRSHSEVSGFCYTQLTDVEQEQNGIYNYDRTEKFDMKRVAEIFSNL